MRRTHKADDSEILWRDGTYTDAILQPLGKAVSIGRIEVCARDGRFFWIAFAGPDPKRFSKAAMARSRFSDRLPARRSR